MKIAPLKVSDPWFGRIMTNGQVQAETLRGVPIESTVEMELVELLHGGPEDNYRPYLHLRGELTSAKPVVELPYGVDELVLRRGSGLSVDAFYDFNPRQLNDLVGKGYFTEAFRVPDEMSGIPWALPGKADFLVVAPEFADQPPVVFMSVHDQSELGLDETTSGYDLSAYFPDYTPQAQEQAENAAVVDAPERGGDGLDMFSDVEFDERRSADHVVPRRPVEELDQRASVPTGVFSRLVSEIESQQIVEPEVTEEPELDAIVPGSPVDVYLSRVSPGVDRVLSGEPTEAEHTEDEPDVVTSAPAQPDATSLASDEGFLDLSEPEPELAPLPMATGETAAEAQQAAANRRAARIRAELVDDDASPFGDEVQPDL